MITKVEAPTDMFVGPPIDGFDIETKAGSAEALEQREAAAE